MFFFGRSSVRGAIGAGGEKGVGEMLEAIHSVLAESAADGDNNREGASSEHRPMGADANSLVLQVPPFRAQWRT